MESIITIGRDSQCTICVPERYTTVSNLHADIEEVQGALYYTDHSSNGTVINGRRIKGVRVLISPQDEILLANSYQLSWTTICRYFPDGHRATVKMDAYRQPQSRATSLHNEIYNREERVNNNNHNSNTDKNQSSVYKPSERQNIADVEKAKAGWNWGGFLLGCIWGVGHRCWWPLFTVLGIIFLYPVFCYIFPVIGVLVSPIAGLSNLIIAIYLGINGNAIGWENGCYENIEHFHRKERRWTIAGLIVWGLNFLFAIVVVACFASFLAALL